MAATTYQCGILRTLASQRKQRGESYVAGGVALNQALQELPAGELGKCVISRDAELFRGSEEELRQALKNQEIGFHQGRLGGSWPVFR